MADTKLLYEVVDGIGWIRFNKPGILNAIDAREIERLVELLRESSADPEVKMARSSYARPSKGREE